MICVFCPLIINALLLAQPPPSKPEAGNARALWVSIGIDAHEEAVRASVLRSSSMMLFEPDEAQRALEVIANTLGPDPSALIDTTLKSARDDFLQLKLERSIKAYSRALSLLLKNDRAAVPAKRAARILFERALVLRAASKEAQADQDINVAVALNPDLQPDPNQYGPPVFRALQRAFAKRARAPKVPVRIDRAPKDAVIRLNGAVFPPGAKAFVRGAGPHLITAERVGYRARAMMVSADLVNGLSTAVVLEAASGPLLAAQVYEAWNKVERLSRELAMGVARCLKIPLVLEASLAQNSEVSGVDIDLVLKDVASGQVRRSVRGRRLPWEPWPFAVLTEGLEGRTLQPGELTLTLSAPGRVPPSTPIELNVHVFDKRQRLAALEATCGESKSKRALDGMPGPKLLTVFSPNEDGKVACTVVGLDGGGEVLVRAPPEGTLAVEIGELAGKAWYKRWYVWSAFGLAVGAATFAAAFALQPDPRVERDVQFQVIK